MTDTNLHIDFEKISQELKIRPEVAERLILSFSASLTDKLTGIQEALSQNDTMKMRALLHEIKGTSGNLRLETIKSAETVMHDAVKAGEDPSKLSEYFKELKKQVEALQQYLSQRGQ